MVTDHCGHGARGNGCQVEKQGRVCLQTFKYEHLWGSLDSGVLGAGVSRGGQGSIHVVPREPGPPKPRDLVSTNTSELLGNHRAGPRGWAVRGP